jgi:exonuclease SbcD
VRVRWTVANEDRHEIDRQAIQQILADAADVKLEGRIVPVVRTRAPGIAQLTNLADKVRAWADTTQVRAEPLLDCLERAQGAAPADIVARVLDPGDSHQLPPDHPAALELEPRASTLAPATEGEHACSPSC